MLRLTVNATLSNNNTVLRCHALLNSRGATSVTSDTAILQIVSGMTLCVCAVFGYTCIIHYYARILVQHINFVVRIMTSNHCCAESPVVPNPVVIIQTPTSLLLKWSPPFLWPGYHIDYFVVSTINKTNDHLIAVNRINATFNDVILTLSKSLSDEHENNCNKFMFSISAFSDYYGVHPQIFNIIGGFSSGEKKLNLSVIELHNAH